MAEESVVASAVVSVPESVVIHPLVLLSVVDHYNRVARGTEKRVVGVLLGESYKGRLDVTNSYAIPFEEDRKDPSVWFLDHNYHEELFLMFRKVNGALQAFMS
jgi:26S proteasome regulatory subunit N8